MAQTKAFGKIQVLRNIKTDTLQMTSDTIFDVLIVGGSIIGFSTGLQLQKAGKSVLIVESYNIGFGSTGGTTAHFGIVPVTRHGLTSMEKY